MFSVTQNVENTSGADVRLAPYGIVARHGLPDDLQNFFILHEGVVRKVDGQLDEISYDNVTDLDFVERERAQAEVASVEQNGWIGFTDKYWMTTLIPGDGQPFTLGHALCRLGRHLPDRGALARHVRGPPAAQAR